MQLHIGNVTYKCINYFPPYVYVRNVKKKITAKEENSLVELSCDTLLRSRFSRYHLSDFWLL